MNEVCAIVLFWHLINPGGLRTFKNFNSLSEYHFVARIQIENVIKYERFLHVSPPTINRVPKQVLWYNF